MIFQRILGIAACDPNGVMGKNGKLPWHCPEELQHFADTTLGSPMIMGYRTFLTLPAPYFENRKTIIFTHHKPKSHDPNQCFVSSLTEFFSLDGTFQDLYVIGGAQIYSLFLRENLIDEFILTKMTHTYDGDTFFPLSLLYCARLGFVNFGGSQKGPDLNDREEGHIAAIWQALDRSKMGPYDGPPNSHNLTGRSISGWKEQTIRKTPLFTIHRYFRNHASKSS